MGKGVTLERNTGPVTINNSEISSRATILGKLIEIIASSDCENVDLDRVPAEVEHKIQFNDLKTHKWLIDEYVASSLLVDESILELNQKILNGSTKLKRQMKMFYHNSLVKYSVQTNPFDLGALKSNSDNIAAEVIDLATDFVKKSSDLKNGYYDEDIDYGVALITSYSIIECVVLENPNDHD